MYRQPMSTLKTRVCSGWRKTTVPGGQWLWSCCSWALVEAVKGGEHCPRSLWVPPDASLTPPVGLPGMLVRLTGRPVFKRFSFLIGSAYNVSPMPNNHDTMLPLTVYVLTYYMLCQNNQVHAEVQEVRVFLADLVFLSSLCLPCLPSY